MPTPVQWKSIRKSHASPDNADALRLWKAHGPEFVGLGWREIRDALDCSHRVAQMIRYVVNDLGLLEPPDGWPTGYAEPGPYHPDPEEAWSALRARGGIVPGRAKVDKASPRPVRLNPPPPGELDVEELIADRCKRFERRRKARAQDEARVKVEIEGPFGLLLQGDPHVDDDGTDWPLLLSHIRLVQDTPALYVGNVGDLQNNWIGRLQSLYAHQSTTATESWAMARYLIESMRDRWLFLVRGNHDMWSGDGDPLDAITKDLVPVDKPHEVKVAIEAPGMHSPIRLWARHSFPGRSQWNKTHAQGKAAMMRSYPGDLYCSGHVHCWGYHAEERDDGSVWHGLQIGAYKRHDSYADRLGFAPTHHGAALLCILDPSKPPGPGRVQVYHDVEQGADFLTWLRSRR